MKSNDFSKQETLALFKNSWSIAWPMIIILLVDFLVGITDVYVAGRLTKEIQASVGFVSQIYLVVVVVGNAITVGAVSIVSRLFGGNRKEELSNAIYTLAAASLALGVIIGIFAIAISSPVINLLNIPEAVRKLSLPLFRIYAAGIVFHFFLIASNGILRGCRKVKLSLSTMLVVCALNVGLNFVLVFYTRTGYFGIVLSTVISYAAGAALNSIHIKKLITATKRFDLHLLKSMAGIGWPTGLQQIAWQIGGTMLFLIISALQYNTVEIIAAFTNGLRIEAAIYVIAYALNNANAVIVGNLIGEGKMDKAFRNGIATALIGVAVITVQTVLVIANAGPLSAALSKNSTVVNESIRYLYIAMISEPFMAWAVIVSGALNGAGDTRSVMKVVTASQWLVRLPLAYFAAVYLKLGPAAIWWAMNVSILAHAVFISIRYFRKKWMKIEVM